MKIIARQRSAPPLPGVVGPARVERRTHQLLPRLRPGDVAVIDHRDLDRRTAQALVDRGVRAVVNASPTLSGRYPALGPSVLVEAGVPLVDRAGTEAVGRIGDGTTLRLHDGIVHRAGPEGVVLARGRVVDQALLAAELEDTRLGMATQLENFTHNSAEFLRREQGLLLHGEGLPRLATGVKGRPVVVVVPGHDHAAELARIRRFVEEQDPVLIGVDSGADALRAARLRPDIVVVDGALQGADLPAAQAVRRTGDLVVVRGRGSGRGSLEPWERLGLSPVVLESDATAEDTALLLADDNEAAVIIGVGMHATLHEFLDRQRTGLASTYLTRLKVGERLVDASAVPTLYAGRVRTRHLLGVALAGLVAVAAAIGTTPVGQEWAVAATDWLSGLAGLVPDSLPSSIEGLL